MARNLIFLAVLLMALISFVAAQDSSSVGATDTTTTGPTVSTTTGTTAQTTTGEHEHSGSSTIQYSAMFLLVSAISAIISRIH